MKNNLIWVIAGVVILILAAVLAGPKILGKIKTTLGRIENTTTDTSVQNGKYNPATETVSGNITLNLTSPTSGSTTTSPSVEVSGKTTPNAEVFVNDSETKADANGNFKVKITLDEGENTITVAANDSEGNYIERDLIVTYEPPAQ